MFCFKNKAEEINFFVCKCGRDQRVFSALCLLLSKTSHLNQKTVLWFPVSTSEKKFFEHKGALRFSEHFYIVNLFSKNAIWKIFSTFFPDFSQNKTIFGGHVAFRVVLAL